MFLSSADVPPLPTIDIPPIPNVRDDGDSCRPPVPKKPKTWGEALFHTFIVYFIGIFMEVAILKFVLGCDDLLSTRPPRRHR